MKQKVFGVSCLSLGVLVGLFLTSLVNPPASRATGFALYLQGAKEFAMWNSVIANSQGPASNFWNPALLTELGGTQLEIGTTVVIPSVGFTSDATGETWDTEGDLEFPSTLYVTHEVNQSLALGLGVNSTFGLVTEWPDDWEGRYITTKAELVTYNLNPNVAWKLSDRMSVAGGIDILYGDGTDERKMNFFPYGLPDGHQKFEGDGYGYGFNLGLFYKISARVSLGASYRSAIDLDLDGKAKFNLPEGSPAELLASFPNTGGETTLELPSQAFAGLAFKATDNFLVEVGVIWEGWSSYEELKFEFDDPVAGSDATVFEKDWDDVTSFKLGVKYSIDPTLAFSAGYYYAGTPISDETFEPSIPGSDYQSFSFGVQKSFDNLTISATYFYDDYDKRDKNNLVGSEYGLTANGEYEPEGQFVLISLTYKY